MYKCSVIFIAFVVCLIGQNNVEFSKNQQLTPIVSDSFGLSYYSGEYEKRSNGQVLLGGTLHGISLTSSVALNTNVEVHVNGTFARGNSFVLNTRTSNVSVSQQTIGVYLKLKLPTPLGKKAFGKKTTVSSYMMFGPAWTRVTVQADSFTSRGFGFGVTTEGFNTTDDDTSFSYAFGVEIKVDKFVAGIEYISLYSGMENNVSTDITGINVSITYKF